MARDIGQFVHGPYRVLVRFWPPASAASDLDSALAIGLQKVRECGAEARGHIDDLTATVDFEFAAAPGDPTESLVRLADVVSALERVGYTYCESEHERVSASIGMHA